MADRLSAYADWLVANKDKRGTPEFEKVANAYKQLRTTPSNDNQPRDGAIAYSVDRAQQMLGKGIEVAGDLVGSDTVKGFGADIVAQQEKDIAEGGYQPTYTGSLSDTYKEGGIGSALGWIAEKSAENLASGGVALAGTGLAALTAPFSAPAALVIGGGTLVTSGVMGAGETALEMEEKTGDYNSAVAAGTGILIGILDKFGAGKVIPKDKLATMTGEEIVEELIKAGKTNAADEIGKRIVKATVAEGATETAQETAIVGATASQGGEYTAEELADRGLESFVLGGTMGGGTRTGIETTTATGRGIKNATSAVTPKGYSPSDSNAASDLANRIQRISKADNMDLNNVSNKMDDDGAVRAVDQAHVEITTEIGSLKSDINELIKNKDTDTDQVREDKLAVQRAFRMARNKTKNIVGSAELEATERLLGNTSEGQRLLQLFKETNELTGLHNSGYVGGLSKFTDAFSPLPSNTGYSDRALIELPTRLGISGAAAGVTGGASIPAQLGVVATGRAIDGLTGNRSTVARFVREQQGRGSETPDAPSFRSQRALEEYQRQQAKQADKDRIEREKQQRKEQKEQDALKKQQDALAKAEKEAQEQLELEQVNRELNRKNAPATVGSPQDVMQRATGMDKRGVADVLKALERISLGKRLKSAIDQYRRSVDRGGKVTNLSPLIRAVNQLIESTPQFLEKRINEPDRGQLEAINAEEAKIERGKQANKEFMSNLRRKMNDDKSLGVLDKNTLNDAMSDMSQSLGANPVEKAISILENAKDKLRQKDAADKYLTPYIKRMQEQQKRGQADEAT